MGIMAIAVSTMELRKRDIMVNYRKVIHIIKRLQCNVPKVYT